EDIARAVPWRARRILSRMLGRAAASLPAFAWNSPAAGSPEIRPHRRHHAPRPGRDGSEPRRNRGDAPGALRADRATWPGGTGTPLQPGGARLGSATPVVDERTPRRANARPALAPTFGHALARRCRAHRAVPGIAAPESAGAGRRDGGPRAGRQPQPARAGGGPYCGNPSRPGAGPRGPRRVSPRGGGS